MPMEQLVEVWKLYRSKLFYGETELGDRCYELVQLLDPSRLDEQSKAGLVPVKASDVAKEKEKKKLSGYNPLEIKTKPMKEVGYVPETKLVLIMTLNPKARKKLSCTCERLALYSGRF
ncbi:hypothetical protein Tco_0468145 [Tanacetum coccineum]